MTTTELRMSTATTGVALQVGQDHILTPQAPTQADVSQIAAEVEAVDATALAHPPRSTATNPTACPATTTMARVVATVTATVVPHLPVSRRRSTDMSPA